MRLLPRGYSGPFCTGDLVALTRAYRASRIFDVELREYAEKSLGEIYDLCRNNFARTLEESGLRPTTPDMRKMHCALYFSREERVLCLAFPRPDQDTMLIQAYVHDASIRAIQTIGDVKKSIDADIDFIASKLFPPLLDYTRKSVQERMTSSGS